MTGSDWSLIGVLCTVVGAAFAWYGTTVSGRDARTRAEQLAEKSDELAAKSDEISKISQENARLSQELAAFATGGDSLLHLHFERFGGDRPAAEVKHVGKYPVRDTELLFFDVTEQIPEVVAGRVHNYRLLEEGRQRRTVDISYAHSTQRVLSAYPVERNPTALTYAYFIHIGSGTGTYRQIVQFVKIEGAWKQGYRVERVVDGSTTLVLDYFDEGFPTTGVIVRREAKADAPR